MSRAEWNVQEMSNRIFEGSTAAVASIRFNGPFDQDTVDRIDGRDDVFAVSVNEL